jgi:peptidoglycan/LPS O-acetylase OafA/YrhL
VKEKDSIYFPSLNGLRFIAAFMVLYDHVKFFKSVFNVDQYKFPLQTNLGDLGVTLFFVLSGFLITYLLLEEHKKFGKIQLRFFYMRRVLRIFPLYYLTVILSFFVLPHFLSIPHFSENNPLFPNGQTVALTPSEDPSFYKKFLCFSLFLPNLGYLIYDLVPFGSQLWSVGVEEQFYLFWPTFLILFRKRLVLVLAIIAVGIALAPLLLDLFVDYSMHPRLLILKNFLFFFRIDSMALGGIMAWILATGISPVLNVIYSKWFQWLILLCTIGGLLFNIHFKQFHHEIYSILFALLILNLASNTSSIVSLENRLLNYLGKISYGLYIYNPLAIVLSIHACIFLFGGESLLFNICLFLLSVLLTILLSACSYHLFEEKFLKLKPKFSKILSNK